MIIYFPPHEDATSLQLEFFLGSCAQLIAWCQDHSIKSYLIASCRSWLIAFLKRDDHKASINSIGSTWEWLVFHKTSIPEPGFPNICIASTANHWKSLHNEATWKSNPIATKEEDLISEKKSFLAQEYRVFFFIIIAEGIKRSRTRLPLKYYKRLFIPWGNVGGDSVP